MHSIPSNGSTSYLGIAHQVASRVQSIWPGSSQRKSRPHFSHEIAFGSSSNIFATYDSGLELESSNQTHIDDVSPIIAKDDFED
jgi:hypothetical protein